MDGESVEPYELGGNRSIGASQVGETDSPTTGVRGSWQIRFRDMANLDVQRLVANVPEREQAQEVVEGIGRAREYHENERSSRARTIDERKKAPVTTNVETWMRNPRRWDYPGVDDPRTNREGWVPRSENFAERVDKGRGIGAAGADEYEYRDLNPEAEASFAGGPFRDQKEDDQTNGGTTVAASVETGLEDLVGQKPTDELFDLAEHKRQGHQEAREARRGQGGRRTDTHMDEMMKDYLDDLRVIEDELYARDAL